MPLSKEASRERNARRRQDPEYRQKQAAINKSWREQQGKTPARLARKAELMRGYAIKHADRHAARRAVRAEIEAGRMTRQPCEICDAEPAHAHHDDYSKPLDVRWLCEPHHREHHAKATGGAS